LSLNDEGIEKIIDYVGNLAMILQCQKHRKSVINFHKELITLVIGRIDYISCSNVNYKLPNLVVIIIIFKMKVERIPFSHPKPKVRLKATYPKSR